jgi:hypothetical protein
MGAETTRRLAIALKLARATVCALAAGFLLAASATAQTTDWPQAIDAEEGTIVVYQPQVESFERDTITGRAAMALEIKGHDEPIFGALWFTARLDTDYERDLALAREVRVTRVRWPDSKSDDEQRFTEIVEAAVPPAGLPLSLERLSASLAAAEREKKSLAELRNEPPEIVFSEDLAVLLLYDGVPRFASIENTSWERALNTPFAVARDTRGGTCYLSSGTLWYSAEDPLGPWSHTAHPPGDLVKMAPEPDPDEVVPETPPRIIVATEPTEVISTDGKPEWKSLPGGKLLYAENTETPWLRELDTQKMYVLLSGRWFRASSTSGPWAFVRPDQLPASFEEIPPGSDIGGVRTSIAGTEEAEDAILDAEIPQTAAIKRSEATFEAQYDGEPRFEKIAGTSVAYAVNTGQQILEIGGRYYAADNGVWFVSAEAEGPWSVADSVPEDEIQTIPPSSPVYNTTHVHVYQSTPEVVYVGYTPGYLWSFPYYGAPFYGTGYYYRPWWRGPVYYPRPPTWGFHVGYNPWTGWNFGVSWSAGFFRFGVSWSGGGGYYRPGGSYRPWGCCGGWYGGGYRRPVHVNTGNINIGNSINVGNRANVANQIRRNTRIDTRAVTRQNLYNQPATRARVADRATVQREVQRARSARPATGRPNNVYADRSGNVVRPTAGDWEARESGKWQRPDAGTAAARTPTTRPATPATRPAPRQIDRSQLNRDRSARQRGMQRERARPRPMPRGRRR